MIPIGSVLAGYRVRREIGSGATGTIYAVDDPQLPRLDALKVLPAELSADGEFRARFIREADVAAGLDHPNIVSIYDRGETADHQLWIAMQLVDGIDAETAVRAGTMTPRRAVHIIGQVAEALDYAHAHRVLHRDVRPANFLLAGAVGDDERVLLGDFGIARAADDAGSTGTSSIATTMAYTAPEVLNGQRSGPAADLYALGCALFQLLTGEVPYADAVGAAAQARAHLQQPPPLPSTRSPQLGSTFDGVIATAMAKAPGQRYPSGRALAAAAREALTRRDHTTRPVNHAPVAPDRAATVPVPSAPLPAQATGAGAPVKRAGRGKLIAAGTAVATLVAGGLAATTLLGHHRDDQGPPPTTTAGPPTDTVPIVVGSELTGLLLPADAVSKATGSPAKAQGAPWTGFFRTVTADSIDPAKSACIGTVYPVQEASYAGSGSTDRYGLTLQNADADGKTAAVEAVTTFPSAEQAARYVERQQALWAPCAFKEVHTQSSSDVPAIQWRIGAVSNTDELLSASATTIEQGRTYQHVLTSANNVVIDVMAFAGNNADAAATIARGIADRVPH